MASRRIVPPPPRVFQATESRGMLDDFSLRAARQRAKQVPSTLPVFPLPLRNHPLWSGNNNLGIKVPFSADNNNRQTVLKLDEWGMPEVWTVMLGINYTDSLLDNPGFEILALVENGAGGAVQEFVVEWTQGTMFSMPMNALSIVAQYENQDRIPEDLTLTVTLSRGDHANHDAIRSIREFDVVAGTSSENVRIPPFTKSVQVLPLTAATAAVLYDSAAPSFLTIDEDPASFGTPAAVIRGDQLLSFGNEGVPMVRKGKYVHWTNGSAIQQDLIYVFHLRV